MFRAVLDECLQCTRLIWGWYRDTRILEVLEVETNSLCARVVCVQSADGGDVWPSLPSGNASSATADLHSPTTAAAAAVSATSSGGFTQAVMGGGKASGAASMSDFVNDLCTLAMDCADADVKGTTTGAGSAITKPTSAGTAAGVAVAMATSETGVGESVAGGGSVSAGKSKSRRRRDARRSAQQNSSSSAAAGTPDQELDASVRVSDSKSP